MIDITNVAKLYVEKMNLWFIVQPESAKDNIIEQMVGIEQAVNALGMMDVFEKMVNDMTISWNK